MLRSNVVTPGSSTLWAISQAVAGSNRAPGRSSRGTEPAVEPDLNKGTLLATTALEHDLYLVTRNIRDPRHSGSAMFNPWEDEVSAFPILAKRRRRRASGT